jgi:hypothetical protein
MNQSTTALRRFADSKAALWVALATVTAVFVWTRMQYWVELPFPRYYADSETYLGVAYDIANGKLPLFDVRTPAYPLLLYTVLEGTGSVFALVLVQQMATLLSAYALCIAAFLVRRSLGLWALIPAIAIAGSQQTQLYELAVMAEGTYSAAIVFAFAALLAGLPRRSSGWLMASSLAMAIAVLLRPSGLFLAGTYVLVLTSMAIYRPRWTNVVSFALPLPAIVLALCVYNLATLGKFTISPFGPANLSGVTATFATEVPDFPPSVNAAIAKFRHRIPAEDQAVLATRWNAWQLSDIYHRHYNEFLWFTLVPALEEAGVKGMMAQVPYFSRLNRQAISQHLPEYGKFIYASMYILLTGVGRNETDGQRVSYERLYGEERYLKNSVSPGWRSQLQHLDDPESLAAFRRFCMREYDGPPPQGRRLPPLLRHGLTKAIADQPEAFSRWTRLADRYNVLLHAPLFIHTGWLALSPLLVLMSLFVLARRRGPRATPLAALGIIVPLSLLGASLLTALVEEGLARYVYPTRFLFYMAPLMMIAIYQELRARSG